MMPSFNNIGLLSNTKQYHSFILPLTLPSGRVGEECYSLCYSLTFITSKSQFITNESFSNSSFLAVLPEERNLTLFVFLLRYVPSLYPSECIALFVVFVPSFLVACVFVLYSFCVPPQEIYTPIFSDLFLCVTSWD
jgi:hypothetical protein